MVSRHAIRVSRPEDYDAVSRLLLASYSNLLTGHYDSDLLEVALPFITNANPTLLSSGTYYVAEINGAVVGCGGWSKEPPGSREMVEGEAHVRHIASHPQWLRRGIGKALLARCILDVQPLIRTLHCFSTLNAEPFYRACGFEAVERIEIPLGPTVTIPVMQMKREFGARI